MLDENLTKQEENEDSKGLKRKCDEMWCSPQDAQATVFVDGNATDETSQKKLSKKELRRIRRKEKWLAFKPEKRAKEREKLKVKRQEARLNNIDLGPSRKILKSKTMANSSCKIHVAVDMSFDDYMADKDLSKCLKQLLHCYTLNRRAVDPMQLYFTSFSGKCKSHMEKNNGYKNWDVNFREEYITEVFPKEKLVYLSSDSPNTILTLEEDKVYVIGGLVDHNVHKGLCHKIAVGKGISHAQLPIGEFLKMSSRKVLTVDHVFEILLNVSTGLSWEEAFLKVLPKRKGVLLKSDDAKDKNLNSTDTTQSSCSENVLPKSVHKLECEELMENQVSKQDLQSKCQELRENHVSKSDHTSNYRDLNTEMVATINAEN